MNRHPIKLALLLQPHTDQQTHGDRKGAAWLKVMVLSLYVIRTISQKRRYA